MVKRLLDLTLAMVGLLILLPLLPILSLLIKFESKGPVFFRQERVGRDFRPFRIFKFRTMADHDGAPITIGGDSRITRVGRFLRKFKVDELPQIFNILSGDMSVVGPRPEVPKYVSIFKKDYEEILRVKPGLTDYASIAFIDEATVLARYESPEKAYTETILPEKIKLAKRYVRNQTIGTDLQIILATLHQLLIRSRKREYAE